MLVVVVDMLKLKVVVVLVLQKNLVVHFLVLVVVIVLQVDLHHQHWTLVHQRVVDQGIPLLVEEVAVELMGI